MSKQNIAIIPARGGSKRLPRKNILNFLGKPLIQWTIDAAKASGCFDEVIVSTDDEEILQISQKLGAVTPGLRPAELATDQATTADVLKYTVETLPFEEDVQTVCLLQPTSPLRLAVDIRCAFDLYHSEDCDAVVSVSEVQHPIEWTCNISSDTRLVNFPKKNFTRSQDYDSRFRLNGSIYLLNKNVIDFFGRPLYEKDVVGLVTPSIRSIDIDTYEDFKIAEYIYQEFISNFTK